MKRKWLAGLMILALLCTLAGGGAILAFADDSKEAAAVQNVNSTDFWGQSVLINMGESQPKIGNEGYYSFLYGDPNNVVGAIKPYLVYIDKSGNNLVKTVEISDNSISINRGTENTQDGSVITLKTGLVWVDKEIKADTTYIYTGTAWSAYTPTTFTANQTEVEVMKNAEVEVTFSAGDGSVNYNNAPVTYTVSDGKATVVGNGLSAKVTGVSVGTTKLTATLYGGRTAEVDITVSESLELDHISVTGKISVYEGRGYFTEDDCAGLVGTKTYKAAEGETPETSTFTVTKSMLTLPANFDTVGETDITVTEAGKTCTVPLEIKAVPVPTMTYQAEHQWDKQHAIRFDIPNSSTLNGRVVHGLNIIELNGAAYGGTLATAVGSNFYNYVLYSYAAQEGDVVTIKSGAKLYNSVDSAEYPVEDSAFAAIHADYTFVYINGAWVKRVPATGMELTATKNRITVGETLNLSVGFTPVGGYTENTVTYESGNTDVATVSAAGVVTAVSAGSATITAKCDGLPDATFSVTVEAQAELVGITVKENKTQSVYIGQNYVLPTVVKNVKYGDEDPVEESATITAENISGEFDKDTVGTYTLTVTLEGYTDTFTVTVKSLDALTITSVSYDDSFFGFHVVFTEDDNSGIQVGQSSINNASDYFKIEDSQGVDITSGYNFNRHQERVFATRATGTPFPEIGTKITVKQGFPWMDVKEIKADVTYIYVSTTAPLEVYDADTHDVKTLTVTNNPEDNVVRVGATKTIGYKVNDGAATTAHFTSSDTDVATVTADGIVQGVAVGTATITVKAGDKTATYAIEVREALPIKGVELVTSYKIWTEKGANTVLPEDFTARVVYDAGKDEDGNDKEEYGYPFALTAENATINQADINKDVEDTYNVKLTVTFGGERYELSVFVEIFEVVDMQIKELAVVEWFGFDSFIQFPNSSMNGANITNTALTPDAQKVIYVREGDNTAKVNGIWVLGGGNLCILPSFIKTGVSLDNFGTEYYHAGDKVILQQGLTGYLWTGGTTSTGDMIAGTGMIVRECILREEVTYLFDGTGWLVYVPYTDVVAPSQVTVVLGQSKLIGATRDPANATEGKFAYSIDDETIATVNASGRIEGKKIGDTTVTVTLSGGVAGEKTATVTVHVVDGIVGLDLGEDAAVTVTVGTEKLDLSGLNAKLVWASGKTEDVDLSEAEVVGYDKDTLGESEVTVEVTVNGVTYSAQLNVNVVEAKKVSKGCGCGSAIDGFVSMIAACAVLFGAAFIVVAKRARKESK